MPSAQERKKKQIIIASVVGSIVVLLAVIGIFFALNGHKNTADLVSVPDFTDTSNISQARVEEQLKALGLKLDARDDSTSSQPKGTITKQNPKGGKKVAKAPPSPYGSPPARRRSACLTCPARRRRKRRAFLRRQASRSAMS